MGRRALILVALAVAAAWTAGWVWVLWPDGSDVRDRPGTGIASSAGGGFGHGPAQAEAATHEG